MEEPLTNTYLTGSLTADLVVLGLSLLLSAFFSSSETALTALSEHRARALIESRKRNKSLELWLAKPNQVLTTILIGNNVVNTFTAAVATLVAQNLFSNSALSIAVGLTTIAILIVGEITPKTFAKHNAERLAPVAMTVIAVMRLSLLWAVVPFTWMSKGLVRVFGGEATRSGPFVTEEDLAYYVKIAQQEGVIEEHEGELVASALDFGDTVVREVMISRTEISAIKLSATLPEVLAEVKASGHTRMPVYGESLDDIKGIFHTKELLKQVEETGELFNLKRSMHKPFFVPELMKIAELLNEFQRRRSHLAVVVDEYGGTAGIVCLEDIIEEIVGEIHDEYDAEREEIRRIDDNRYVADGKASIHDLAETIGIEVPDEGGYETLGGFLIALRGKMPQLGDRLEDQGWMFVITDADQRKVTRVEVLRVTGDSGPVPKVTPVAQGTESRSGASQGKAGTSGGKDRPASESGKNRRTIH